MGRTVGQRRQWRARLWRRGRRRRRRRRGRRRRRRRRRGRRLWGTGRRRWRCKSHRTHPPKSSGCASLFGPMTQAKRREASLRGPSKHVRGGGGDGGGDGGRGGDGGGGTADCTCQPESAGAAPYCHTGPLPRYPTRCCSVASHMYVPEPSSIGNLPISYNPAPSQQRQALVLALDVLLDIPLDFSVVLSVCLTPSRARVFFATCVSGNPRTRRRGRSRRCREPRSRPRRWPRCSPAANDPTDAPPRSSL